MTSQACSDCGVGAVEQNGELICQQCNLVVADQTIDHGPEWLSFEDSQDRSRVGDGSTHTLLNQGSGSIIGRDNTGDSYQMARMRRLQKQTGTKAEHNRHHAFNVIQRVTTSLGVSHLNEQACLLFKRVQQAGLLQSRAIESIAAATVYAAARIANQSRTLDEVAAVSQMSKQRIQTHYDVINRGLDVPIPAPHPADIIPRLADQLSIPTHIEQHASDLAVRAIDDGAGQGNKPQGVASACLYLAAGGEVGPISLKEAGDAAGVASQTVRRTKDDLDEALDVSKGRVA